MLKINVKDARDRISDLLDRVERGEEITILRRGKTIARLTPPERKAKRLPDLTEFRAKIRIKGSLTEALMKERRESRY
jgi:prevent-host-death family protein